MLTSLELPNSFIHRKLNFNGVEVSNGILTEKIKLNEGKKSTYYCLRETTIQPLHRERERERERELTGYKPTIPPTCLEELMQHFPLSRCNNQPYQPHHHPVQG